MSIDSLKRLQQLNKENARLITVNAGVLRAARSEILAHVELNGKGLMTDIVLGQLNKAIGDED